MISDSSLIFGHPVYSVVPLFRIAEFVGYSSINYYFVDSFVKMFCLIFIAFWISD